MREQFQAELDRLWAQRVYADFAEIIKSEYEHPGGGAIQLERVGLVLFDLQSPER